MKGDKKKESKEKKVKKPSKVMMFLRDERFHFALGIVLFFSSLYLLLAMMSFFSVVSPMTNCAVFSEAHVRFYSRGLKILALFQSRHRPPVRR